MLNGVEEELEVEANRALREVVEKEISLRYEVFFAVAITQSREGSRDRTEEVEIEVEVVTFV